MKKGAIKKYVSPGRYRVLYGRFYTMIIAIYAVDLRVVQDIQCIDLHVDEFLIREEVSLLGLGIGPDDLDAVLELFRVHNRLHCSHLFFWIFHNFLHYLSRIPAGMG